MLQAGAKRDSFASTLFRRSSNRDIVSAGAITALVLALGYESADIKTLLATPDRFNAFFDGPNPGKYRVVDQKGQLQAGFDPAVDAGVVEDRQVGIGKVIPAVISKLL